MTPTLEKQLDELGKKLNDLTQRLATLKGSLEELQKKISSSSPPKQPKEPVKIIIQQLGPNLGLRNSNGNDCFFSAAFQALSQIDPFIQKLEELPEEDKTEVQREFLGFIQSLRGEGIGKYNPSGDATRVFRNFITTQVPNNYPLFSQLKGLQSGQQDAQEFFSIFLNVLTEFDQKTLDETYKLFQDFLNNNFNLISDAFLTRYFDNLATLETINVNNFISVVKTAINDPIRLPEPELNNISAIDTKISSIYTSNEQVINDLFRRNKQLYNLKNIFLITEKKQRTCTTCYTTDPIKEERLMLLPLPIVQQTYDPEIKGYPPINELSNCLMTYAKENIEKRCNSSSCKGENRIFEQTISFKTPTPPIITIGFRRFLYGNLSDKLTHKVTFPVNLNLAPHTDKPGQSNLYDLFGIVIHSGGTGGGHYYAYTKDRFDKKWRCYNDSSVREVTQQEIQDIADQKKEAGGPYLLFYEWVSE